MRKFVGIGYRLDPGSPHRVAPEQIFKVLNYRLNSGLLALLIPLTLLLIGGIKNSQAVPQTWFDPSISITGAVNSAQFGGSLACSRPASSLSNASYLAIGAPAENSNEGAVYIYNPDSPAAFLQKITSSFGDTNYNFGAAVAFIEDINGDGIDELAVGEPRILSLSGSGEVRVYLSTNSTPPFSYCGSINSTIRAQRLIEIDRDGLTTWSRLAVGSPNTEQLGILEVITPGGGGPSTCDITAHPSGWSGFEAPFGFSLGEVQSLTLDSNKILVGSPQPPDYGAGRGDVYLIDRDLAYPGMSSLRQGEPGELFGLGLAAIPSNPIFAFCGQGYQTIHVTNLTKNSLPEKNICSITADVPPPNGNFGTSLAHLDTAFTAFLGGKDAIFAATTLEAATDGSVTLFGASEASGCSSLKVYNNCIEDLTQNQGAALTGGTHCQGTYQGNKKPMLVVGSPGWNISTGRVDIIFEGSQLGAIKDCGAAPTSTPTPTPTITPVMTSTPTPIPLDTSTPTPTPMPGDALNPIPIKPGSGGLPPLFIEPKNSKGLVQITFPAVVIDIKAERSLTKAFKLKPSALRKLLSKGAITFEYVATITQQRFTNKVSKRGKLEQINPQEAIIANLEIECADCQVTPPGIAMAAASTSTKQSQVTKIIRSRNRKTSARLTPGQSFSAIYLIEFKIKGQKATAVTKPSAEFRFKT